MTVRRALRALILLAACGLAAGTAPAGPRLDAVRAQGELVCGVARDDPGFAVQTADGRFEGLEPDLCRAIAASLIGARHRVRWVPLETVHQFLADPHIDLVFHRLSWTLTREAPGQLEFGPVVFYEAAASGALEPLAPLLRSDDADFGRAVRWTLFALIEAWQRGLGRIQAASPGEQPDWPPADTGAALGLSRDWARQAVAEAGHLGEMLARHRLALRIGDGRDPNRLWRDGGLFLAPPVR